MYIKWITNEEIDKIYFPVSFQEKEISSLEKINFHFGLWEKELSVQFLDELSDNVIGLSTNLRDDVFIPDDLFYEINTTEDSLSLGPVILYVVSKQFVKRLNRLKKRFKKILPFNGLIIVSSAEGINTEKKTIKGYYLQQKPNRKKSNWKEGVFPYPGAVFKRKNLPQNVNKHLYEVTNGRVFNSDFFNKWEMWKWLSPNQIVRSHIPHTTELKSLAKINNMLKIYPSIYLKPKSGSQGNGIIEIKRLDNQCQITDSKNRVTHVENGRLGSHPIIKRLLKKKKKYMIQQGVPVQHDSRNVDFRIYMQKDETKQWKCTGFIGRFAKPGSITTNLHHIDYILPGKKALQKLFSQDQHDLELIEQKIVNVCIDACQTLDQHGCYGDLAIDFILTSDSHVWILEMNKRYGYKSFPIIKDLALYGKIIRNPFLYASALAGFIIKK
ncbi:MAG: YheC/YheD family protein [Paenisporosarcina sp.]|nr:YheC/YheD family protein [Paenisporosarcina sp.]